MPRPIHFEIPAGNPERIIGFYSTLFGWKFNKWDSPQDYWLIDTGEGPGINGGLMPRREPGSLTVNTIQVDSLDQSLKVVTGNGGTEVMPKLAVKGIGWLAYCKDPKGTLFGMMQMDPTPLRTVSLPH